MQYSFRYWKVERWPVVVVKESPYVFETWNCFSILDMLQKTPYLKDLVINTQWGTNIVPLIISKSLERQVARSSTFI